MIDTNLLFNSIKTIHVLSAAASIAGFILRGYWMFTANALLNSRSAKTLPHIIDTVLLGSAVGMLLIWHASPFSMGWLSAKIVALLVYIGLGMVALRFGKTRRVRVSSWLLALLVAAYIVAVALTKSAQGFFTLLL
jgi:uncharacterized membrane protein SirB2